MHSVVATTVLFRQYICLARRCSAKLSRSMGFLSYYIRATILLTAILLAATSFACLAMPFYLQMLEPKVPCEAADFLLLSKPVCEDLNVGIYGGLSAGFTLFISGLLFVGLFMLPPK